MTDGDAHRGKAGIRGLGRQKLNGRALLSA
jgi:hypothetical protein